MPSRLEATILVCTFVLTDTDLVYEGRLMRLIWTALVMIRFNIGRRAFIETIDYGAKKLGKQKWRIAADLFIFQLL